MGKNRDPEMMRTVAWNIQRLRKAKGWSQKKLKEEVGWRYQAMVSQIECGRTGVGPQTLRKLSTALGVEPGEFYRTIPAQDGPVTESVVLKRVFLRDLRRKEDDHPSLRSQNSNDFDLARRETTLLSGLITESQAWAMKLFLPKASTEKEDNDTICVLIEDDSMKPHFYIGDTICIDRSDRPQPQMPVIAESVYAVRLEDAVRLCRLEVNESMIALHDLKHGGEDPIFVDLRAHPSSVIGRVVWVFRGL